MIRLMLSMLCSLALALAPVAANAAATSPDRMADCAMGKNMPAKPANAKTDCCVPVCQSPASAMLPDHGDSRSDTPAERPQLAWTPVKELTGITSTGLDPPPRA